MIFALSELDGFKPSSFRRPLYGIGAHCSGRRVACKARQNGGTTAKNAGGLGIGAGGSSVSSPNLHQRNDQVVLKGLGRDSARPSKSSFAIIRPPACGQAFPIGESRYADIGV
jgi:hypothetical protein